MFASSLKRQEVAKYLESPETFATTLLAIVIDNYGTEAMEWEPETLLHELRDDFNVDIPQINHEKLQALITALTTDLFYTDWITFNYICEALNNDPVSYDVLDPATPEQMAWAVTELALNEESDETPEWDDEVRRYIGANLSGFGMNRPPDILKMAILPEQPPQDDLELDAALAQATYDRSYSDRQAVENYLKDHLQQCLEQLNSVPLQTRSSDWDQTYKSFRSII